MFTSSHYLANLIYPRYQGNQLKEEQLCTANEMLDQRFQIANINELVSYQRNPILALSESQVETHINR